MGGRRFMGTVLAGAALLMATACGSDGDGTSEADDETTTTTVAETTTTAAETTTTGRSLPWLNLQPGDCLEAVPTGSGFSSVDTIICTEPHEGEVVFRGQPGNAGEEGRCTESFTTYAGRALDGSGFDLTWFTAEETTPSSPPGGVPTLPAPGGAGADLMVVCVAISTAGTTTGSIAA